MKFLRTIRFDVSDEHVFERAAPSGEWAIPGSIIFAGQKIDALTGKNRQTFANGFLSVESAGHATLVTVTEMRQDEFDAITSGLAAMFRDQFGAPDEQTALKAAEDEIAFVAEMCAQLPVNTLLALSRAVDEDGGIRESFRTIEVPTGTPHARVWDVVEDAEDAS